MKDLAHLPAPPHSSSWPSTPPRTRWWPTACPAAPRGAQPRCWRAWRSWRWRSRSPWPRPSSWGEDCCQTSSRVRPSVHGRVPECLGGRPWSVRNRMPRHRAKPLRQRPSGPCTPSPAAAAHAQPTLLLFCQLPMPRSCSLQRTCWCGARWPTCCPCCCSSWCVRAPCHPAACCNLQPACMFSLLAWASWPSASFASLLHVAAPLSCLIHPATLRA